MVNQVESAIAHVHFPIQTKIAVNINPIKSAPIGWARLVGIRAFSKAKVPVINAMTLAIAPVAFTTVFWLSPFVIFTPW